MRLIRGKEQFGGGWVDLSLVQESVPAIDQQLASINALPGILKPLTAADVHVRGIRLCNDLPFKDGRRRITPNGLAQIASLMRGVPFMLNHDVYSREALPVGRAFHGWTETDLGGVTWACALFYVPREHPLMDTDALVATIDGGTITQASIGMYAKSFACSICDEQIGYEEHEHAPGATYSGKACFFDYDEVDEVDEFSAVMSGMIDGTHYFLAASAGQRAAEDPNALEAAAMTRAEHDPIQTYFEREALDPWAALKGAFKQS